MKRPKAPAPIDPVKTAAASTSTNVSTAIANTNLGNVNQVGPESSLTYKQTGMDRRVDPYTGQLIETPTYTAETRLNPAQQALYDQNLANRTAMSRQAGDMLGGIGGVGSAYEAKADELLAGLDTTGDIRGRVEEALMARLNPQIQRDRQAMETQLANQGLTLGSRAYSAAQDDLNRGANDARLSAILAAGNEERATRGARLGEIGALGGEARARRGARLGEIGALQSGGMQPVPQYNIAQPARAATTDTAGLINANYQQQVQNYQTQVGQNQSLLGGLFGLGAAAITAAPSSWWSDRRLKTDIEKVEERPGPDVYDFRYKTDPPGTKRRGYMAQEVRKTRPDAVKKMGKFLAVDYSKLPAVR